MHRVVFIGIALLCIVSATAAQLTVPSVSSPPGTNIEINVNYGNEDDLVTAVQFDLEFDGSQLSFSAVAGAAAVAAGKMVSSNQLDSNSLRVIVAGLNQNVIGDGVLVVLTVSISARTPGADYPLSLAAVSATDQAGGAVAISAMDGTLTVVGTPPTQIFPQYVDGIVDGTPNRTRVIIRNNSDQRDTGTVEFLDSSGSPQEVPVDGVRVSSVSYDLRPCSSTEVITDGTSDLLLSGPVAVRSDRGGDSSVEATLIFDLLGHFVSVDAAPLRSQHQVYVSFGLAEKTGIASYNSGTTDVTLDLVLLDAAGLESATPIELILGAAEQLSVFLDDPGLFETFLGQNPSFNGTLNIRVRDSEMVALIGLIQRLDTGALISVAASANPAP